ncbi:hypothetical protein [Mycolicibacterium gilvum]|uniref:von Willebrand factor, type A n=2 Tax=Mycolicibacterium gilvum TaxID=1804 RepID=A0A378SI98_9MYCO|nr:hypothetical protein [Mycolicibacterium gilvum]ABP42538.1 conserved hypothetical protein [Mycolicibacterium gilvum PYR-GCK]MCV7056214.1 hypothetical protein [Mycolicibacterium gilvum]STZ41636.1 Uncharacterised protein [Mycolicibacterium gilvum]
MDLTWWPVAALGAGAVVLVIAVAILLPVTGNQDRRLPLANTDRLTRLPEYRAVLRRQTRAAVVTLTLLILLCGTTALVSARPSEPRRDEAGAVARQDIMLCAGSPVDEPATSDFLRYFARQAPTYGAERIGLTSSNRRLIPLTRDHQFAAGRLGDFARNSPAAPTFASSVTYADYSPTVADVLALCLTGFPDFENESTTRRSLIYVGPGSLRAPGDTRPSLYTDAETVEMARRAGVQISAIATPGRDTGALSAAVGETGGQFFRFDPARVDGQLDAIRAAAAAPPEGIDVREDSPVVALIVALALSALLAVSLLAVRR